MLSHPKIFPCFGSLHSITLSLVPAWFILSVPTELHLVRFLLPCQNYSCVLSCHPDVTYLCPQVTHLRTPFGLSQGCTESPEPQEIRLPEIAVPDLTCTPCHWLCLFFFSFAVHCITLACWKKLTCLCCVPCC